MSSRTPSGTYTRAGAARVPVVVEPTQKLSDRAAFCGCCCTTHRRAILFILAVFYLAIAVLSGISVGTGITDHMTHYHGQVEVDATNYKITQVSSASNLSLWTGWLKYNDGISSGGPKDLVSLSSASGVLGFILAFLLLCSLLVAAWKFFSIMCCGARYARQNIMCVAAFLSIIMISFLVSFYAVTSHELDNFAHNSLGVSSKNDIAMVPDYAWYSGFAAALIWLLVCIFTYGLPAALNHDYHQF